MTYLRDSATIFRRSEREMAEAVSQLTTKERGDVSWQLACSDQLGGATIVGQVRRKLESLGIVYRCSGRVRPLALLLFRSSVVCERTTDAP